MHRTAWALTFSFAFACVVIGCSSQPKDPFTEWNAGQKFRDYTPPTARPVAQGSGTLTFTAPTNGTLYVRDTSTMVDVKGVQKPKAVGSGYLLAGTEITFDPAQKRVYAKGREGVRLTDVDATHTYELLFDPSKPSGG